MCRSASLSLCLSVCVSLSVSVCTGVRACSLSIVTDVDNQLGLLHCSVHQLLYLLNLPARYNTCQYRPGLCTHTHRPYDEELSQNYDKSITRISRVMVVTISIRCTEQYRPRLSTSINVRSIADKQKSLKLRQTPCVSS